MNGRRSAQGNAPTSTRRRPNNARSAVTPARKAALDLVRAVRERGVYLSSIAGDLLEAITLDPSDKSFARLLAQGALSLQISLDELIDRTLRSPRDIKPDVCDALRISAYEIVYLRKEDHAAVDQGVELVRSFAPRATGVANYVLHRIVEEKERFPYGDPTESLEAAALFYGFPFWLARAVKKDIGTRNALAFMAESLAPAPVWFANTAALSVADLEAQLKSGGIEFNTCHPLVAGADLGRHDAAFRAHDVNHSEQDAGFDELGACFGEQDVNLDARGAYLGERGTDRDERDVDANGSANERQRATIFQLAHRSDVGNPVFTDLLAHELIVVSDLSAQSIVLCAAATLPARARLLEIGAGRGTKTLLFQSAARQAGVSFEAYDVMDISANKLRGLEARIAHAGGRVDTVIVHDATRAFELAPESYDLVFIDAPCTGLGTLRRHPEIKARLAEDDSRALARIGQRMLEHAARTVKSGGHLMYATCTIMKTENERTIERFLASPAGSSFRLVPIGRNETRFFKTPIEHNGPDLHFACLLQRI